MARGFSCLLYVYSYRISDELYGANGYRVQLQSLKLSNFRSDAQLGDIITKAFQYFERATCIRLQRLRDKPADEESMQNVEWLYITNPSGIRQCVHSNEKKENIGVQKIVFGYDCLSLGQIVHEIMHVLGFSHEHTRPDRDKYITILWNNVKPGYKKYFEKRTNDQLMNIPYDYLSVLHYPPRAFSKNGQITIMGQVIQDVRLGQREGLSETDVEKVTYIYGHECIERNRQYLLKTCPSVVRATAPLKNVSREDITDYYRDRLWPYGIVNYKLKDKMEFTTEERENIQSVISHIEKETCIRFKDISEEEDNDDRGEADGDRDVEQLADSEGVQKSGTETNGEGAIDNVPYSDDAGQMTGKLTENEGFQKSGSETNSVGAPESPQNSDDVGPVSETGGDIVQLADSDNPGQSGAEGKNDIVKLDSDNGSKSPAIPDNSKSLLRKGKKKKQQKVRLSKIIKPEQLMKPRNTKIYRRHAQNILVLERSSEPGCACPPPGKPFGNAVLKISADCFNSVNDLLHLIVHILGLEHQHNMHDRDDFLHILWDKLTPEIRNEMKDKLPPAASVGFTYDYQSVMHYPWLQIKNGVTNVMYPIWNDGWAMGHWQGLSSIDVQKLNHLYFEQCVERKKQESAH
ncbi:hypothetical protein evm_001415 [Chilo suppressalis]|nr:hypothetical protein evm_001415 [Chilo suppressalis]